MKGSAVYISVFIATQIIIIGILAVGVKNINNMDDLVRRETVNLTAERVESAGYALNSMSEDSYMELQFKEDAEYEFTEESGQLYISFEYFRQRNSEKLETPNSLRLSEEAEVNKICLRNKGSHVLLEPGGCN